MPHYFAIPGHKLQKHSPVNNRWRALCECARNSNQLDNIFTIIFEGYLLGKLASCQKCCTTKQYFTVSYKVTWLFVFSFFRGKSCLHFFCEVLWAIPFSAEDWLHEVGVCFYHILMPCMARRISTNKKTSATQLSLLSHVLYSLGQ